MSALRVRVFEWFRESETLVGFSHVDVMRIFIFLDKDESGEPNICIPHFSPRTSHTPTNVTRSIDIYRSTATCYKIYIYAFLVASFTALQNARNLDQTDLHSPPPPFSVTRKSTLCIMTCARDSWKKNPSSQA